MAQRIVVNKHYSNSSEITRDKFLNNGELIISNEFGSEGIFIINTNGDVVKIGPDGSGSGSSSGTPTGDYVDRAFLRDYLRSQCYMTSADTASYVNSIENALNILQSGFTAHKAENINDFQELNDRIDSLSGITAEVVTDEHIRDLAAEEIAKIVDSADTRFDTLKEIADWIINDSTGAAEMANDISEIKGSVEILSAKTATNEAKNALNEMKIDALSGTVSTIEGNVETNSGKIEELSATTRSLKDYIDAVSGNTEALDALREYIDEQIRRVQKSGDHVFLSRSDYDTLIANGMAVVSGETIIYADDIYYCIYEDDGTPATGGTIIYTVSGDVIAFSDSVTESGGMLTLNADVTPDGFINLDSATQPIQGEGLDEPDTNGNITASNANVETINGEDFLNLSFYNITPIE